MLQACHELDRGEREPRRHGQFDRRQRAIVSDSFTLSSKGQCKGPPNRSTLRETRTDALRASSAGSAQFGARKAPPLRLYGSGAVDPGPARPASSIGAGGVRGTWRGARQLVGPPSGRAVAWTKAPRPGQKWKHSFLILGAREAALHCLHSCGPEASSAGSETAFSKGSPSRKSACLGAGRLGVHEKENPEGTPYAGTQVPTHPGSAVPFWTHNTLAIRSRALGGSSKRG